MKTSLTTRRFTSINWPAAKAFMQLLHECVFPKIELARNSSGVALQGLASCEKLFKGMGDNGAIVFGFVSGFHGRDGRDGVGADFVYLSGEQRRNLLIRWGEASLAVARIEVTVWIARAAALVN